jgi:hypothetical protein
MDLTTVTQALDELLEHRPHLPRPPGLERTVLAAWTNAPHLRPGAPDGPMAAVVAVTWPIGAEAGALRGHLVATTAIRDMVLHALTEPVPDPDGRWVIWAAAHAADNLPPAPNTAEVTGRANGRHQWVGAMEDLDVALALGLGNGWLAGHRDAAQRLVDQFADHVVALVGVERLTTTFLNVHTTGDDVVRAIETAAFHAAERDQDHPPPLPRQVPVPNRGPAGRAFTPLHQVNPATRNRRDTSPPPPPGPGHSPGPSR